MRWALWATESIFLRLQLEHGEGCIAPFSSFCCYFLANACPMVCRDGPHSARRALDGDGSLLVRYSVHHAMRTSSYTGNFGVSRKSGNLDETNLRKCSKYRKAFTRTFRVCYILLSCGRTQRAQGCRTMALVVTSTNLRGSCSSRR